MNNVPLINLSNLKIKVNKLGVDKLVVVPVDLSKLSDKVKHLATTTTTTAFNAKINEVKNKIPNITNLATTTALIAVENIIPNVSNLVKKTDYDTKISEIENKITTNHDHDKYITTREFNIKKIYCKIITTNLASKNDIANFVKKTDLDKSELNELSKKVISAKGLTKYFRNKFSILDGVK